MSELASENQRLRKLNQMYQNLFTFAGHEWRNQLSLLNLAVAKLEQAGGAQSDEDRRNTIKRIQQCAAAMQRVSRSFLNQRHIDELAFTPRPGLIDLVRDVIEPVLFSYTNLLASTGQTYQVECHQPGSLVWADHDLLMSVYDNLIGNAIRHGEPNGKIVLNALERSTEHELNVWNSGPGMTPEQMEVIFERFTGAAATGVDGGTGLLLTRRIVEAHGGRLWADSIPGVWANVIFTLPMRGTDKAVRDRQSRPML